MNFSSPTFLFFFLPIFVIFYWLLSSRYRPVLLLVGSVIFYLWGDTLHFPVIAALLLVNFRLLDQIQKAAPGSPKAKRLMLIGLVINIGIVPAIKLFAVTYFSITHIQTVSLSDFSQNAGALNYLPLGISFITLQSLALFIDTYKSHLQPVEGTMLNPLQYSLYQLMFPKVIAGPITRISDVGSQLKGLNVNFTQLSAGLARFVTGLAKKTIIADQLAPMVKAVFALQPGELTTPYAWLGLIGFSLQLYFDFSGYADMALGIGQMLGIKLPENFDFPYLATSITNFWRRWHISLSNWFRDYLFYPLERGRQDKSNIWRYLDVLIVFLATGLWHGITINFIAWGLLHGTAIIYEISPLGNGLKKSWIGFQRLYALLIILIGWVIFRAESLGAAVAYFRALAGLNQVTTAIPFDKMPVMGGFTWIALILGLVFCMPVGQWLEKWINQTAHPVSLPAMVTQAVSKALLVIALLISIAFIVASGFQAVLYSRF